jgi:uncharacterized protein YcfL
MKLLLYAVLSVVILCPLGCYSNKEERVNLHEGVGSDTVVDNIVIRPVTHAFSALIGQGIEIRQAVTHINKDGFLELEIVGYNESYDTRRFEYKVEWLDITGLSIDSKTSVWQQASAAGKSPFAIKAVAPRTNAVNFRMNTRQIPK